MARQTRAERRARRQQQEAQAAPDSASPSSGGVAQRARVRKAQARPVEQEMGQTSSRPTEEKGGFLRGGFVRFVGECWGELKKVEWPTQAHTIQATVVVLIACIVVGAYIWVADVVFKHLVQDVLLR